MSKEIKILSSFICYLFVGLLIYIVGITGVFAETLEYDDYSTKFYFCNEKLGTSSCSSTDYKTSNYATMNGYNDGTSTYQMFTGFYSQINTSLTANVDYVITFNLSYSYLEYNEILGGDYINRFTQSQFMHSNVNILSATVKYDLPQYPVNSANTRKVLIYLSYTIKPTTNISTLYLGSYSTSNYNFGFQNHLYDTVVSIDSISVIAKTDDTMIGQNQTIINQNQTIIDQNNQTNNNLNNIEGALTDSSPTDMSGLGDSAGWLPAGPVDSILTLPLTMLNNLVTNLSSSCQSISIQLPFVKENINLPCIKSLYDKMGVTGTLFTTAGLIASAFILFNYLLALYKWVDDTLTMRENTMPGYFDDNWGGGA